MRRLSYLQEQGAKEPPVGLSAVAKNIDPSVQTGYNPDHDEFEFTFSTERGAAAFADDLEDHVAPDQIYHSRHSVLVKRKATGA